MHFSVGYSNTSFTFLSSIFISFGPITTPKNSTSLIFICIFLALHIDYSLLTFLLFLPLAHCVLFVVATTRWNGTCDMLTSAKLSVGYLVVGITRELNKEPSLYCSSIYINTTWSMLQQYLLAFMSILLPHVLLLRPPCYIYVSWHHTLNLRYIYMHHVYTIRNPCLLTSFLTLTLI